MNIYGEYFYGNKISDYGIENKRVDYGTLAKAFDAVLNNDLMSVTAEIGYWEQVSGMVDNSDEIDELNEQIYEIEANMDELFDDDKADTDEYKELENKRDELADQVDELEREQDEQPEVFQWYIVSDAGARLLQEIDEIVYYNDTLDIYLWGVTHYGTSWDYVLTDIPCMTGVC